MAYFIDSIGFSVGDICESVEHAYQNNLLISSPHDLKSGLFENHYRCSTSISSYDLAKKAVLNIQDHLHDIDMIIYASCLPMNAGIQHELQFEKTRDVKYLMDYTVSRLQHDFNLNKACNLNITGQACTGLLGAIRLAGSLIQTDKHIRRVLCLTADRFPENALYEQSYNLISDGAACCIVSSNVSGFRVLSQCHISNGALSQATDDETVGSYFSYTIQSVEKLLEQCDLTLNNFRYIIPQNTSVKAIHILSRLLGVDAERFYYPSLSRVGHMISGDNLLNLKELLDSKKLCIGDKILTMMAGYGLNWQSMALEYVGL